MSGPRREDEFETYLRDRSVLPGRLAAAEQIEPPRDLDQRVLSQARQAIHAPPLRLARAPRWALPVGLAATILLSFSIILNVSLTRKREQDTPATAALQATESRPPAAPTASAPLAAAPSSSPAYAPSSASAMKSLPAPEARELAQRANGSAAPAPRAAATSSRASQDPQAWLRQIQALRAQGKTDEADAELRRFRAAFPHFPVKLPPPAASEPAK